MKQQPMPWMKRTARNCSIEAVNGTAKVASRNKVLPVNTSLRLPMVSARGPRKICSELPPSRYRLRDRGTNFFSAWNSSTMPSIAGMIMSFDR